jgi:hypothetical protein
MWPWENDFHILVATPPIKLKLRQQIGGGLLIANHLDESLWWANQKHGVGGGSYLVHGNICNYAEPKPFSEPNRHMFDFLHPILLCRITYQSTPGDALICLWKQFKPVSITYLSSTKSSWLPTTTITLINSWCILAFPSQPWLLLSIIIP